MQLYNSNFVLHSGCICLASAKAFNYKIVNMEYKTLHVHMHIYMYPFRYIPVGHSKNDKSILSSSGLRVTGNLYASTFCVSLGSFKAM